jgi:hypothetical protein
MRCPECHREIGYFTADNLPRCPHTGRVVELPERRSGREPYSSLP